MIENRRNLRMWQFIRLHTPPQIYTPAHGTCKLAQAEDESQMYIALFYVIVLIG